MREECGRVLGTDGRGRSQDRKKKDLPEVRGGEKKGEGLKEEGKTP